MTWKECLRHERGWNTSHLRPNIQVHRGYRVQHAAYGQHSVRRWPQRRVLEPRVIVSRVTTRIYADNRPTNEAYWSTRIDWTQQGIPVPGCTCHKPSHYCELPAICIFILSLSCSTACWPRRTDSSTEFALRNTSKLRPNLRANWHTLVVNRPDALSDVA